MQCILFLLTLILSHNYLLFYKLKKNSILSDIGIYLFIYFYYFISILVVLCLISKMRGSLLRIIISLYIIMPKLEMNLNMIKYWGITRELKPKSADLFPRNLWRNCLKDDPLAIWIKLFTLSKPSNLNQVLHCEKPKVRDETSCILHLPDIEMEVLVAFYKDDAPKQCVYIRYN